MNRNPRAIRIVLASAWLFCCAGMAVASSPTLARSAPPDARLFVELRQRPTMWSLPLGPMMMRGMVNMLRPASIPDSRPDTQTRPASEVRSAPDLLGWRDVFAEAVGLDDAEVVDLLFTGPVAMAADGWSGLGDAILLAEPADTSALEKALADRPTQGAGETAIRRYQLGREHQLICDGRIAVVGRSTNRTGILERTVALLEGATAVSLADVAEFRERMSGLPTDCQLLFYAGTNSRTPTGVGALPVWWPADWPALRSAAIGVVLGGSGARIEANGRLEDPADKPGTGQAPVDSLLQLPAATLVAWTQPIDFHDWLVRLETAYPEGAVRYLQTNLDTNEIQERLLDRLVGDCVILVGRRDMAPVKPDGAVLQLPVMVLAVETDDPHTVDGVMRQLASNFLDSLDLEAVPIEEIPVTYVAAEEGSGYWSIPVGRALMSESGCPLLRELEISWTVADRWLVIGTDLETVREIVAARRGERRVLADWAFPEGAASSLPAHSDLQRVVVARPRAVGEMLGSWVTYVARHHPEMMSESWWRDLWKKQRLSRVQLGIAPTARPLEGRVEVGQALEGYPAQDLLWPGDQITAVDGVSLDAEEPIASLKHKVAMRERDDQVTLTVSRGDDLIDVDIPLNGGEWSPMGLNPIRLIGRAAAVLQLFDTATYAIWQPVPGLVKVRVECRFAGATTTPAGE